MIIYHYTISNPLFWDYCYIYGNRKEYFFPCDDYLRNRFYRKELMYA